MAQREFETAWDIADGLDDDPSEPANWHAGDFHPGERIGAPPLVPKRSLVRQVTSACVMIAIAWVAFETHATWRPLLAMSLIKIRSEVVKAETSAVPSAAIAPSPIQPLAAAKEVAEITGTTSPPPQATPAPATATPEPEMADARPSPSPAAGEAEISTSSIAPDDTGTPAPAPLPEPEVDPTDPQQKRAAAVGLHPRVSKVVLASLSDTDYSNARTAIRKALAEAADTDKFIWPRDAGKKHAVFQVHFVAGAAAPCRRYIVTIVKNGWTTTAPPMEKCGIKTAAHQSRQDRAPKGAAPARPQL
jgi:surface antigen